MSKETYVTGTRTFRLEDLPMRESGLFGIYLVFTRATQAGFMMDMPESER